MTPNDLIASAISRERERAGISLSALAVKAGLAKSTISQLEAGNGNPSIETLWAIAAALDVPFSFLFENTIPHSQLIRAGEGERLSSDHSAFSAVLLAKCAPTNRRDLYRVNLTKGSARMAEPHPAGTVEHVIVCDGSVRVGPVGHSEDLATGDYYRYPSNVPHSYEATSDTATLLLVMESSR
ncbi:helix-turn-helix domain-containing protein [Roseovarius sp. EL26]|uniref:helix-turn-helix domain-containing protein n=1 Tax=Roseovarius sp. EL26 TaxID=2126672 RepID=UPI000EA39495|nr:XRE family transcriptional regulator [Roseovarius sp. EL26]